MPVSRPYWDEREMINDSQRPEILAIGDSWFWYPFNNLLNPIFNVWGGKVILALGQNGAEAVDYAGGKFQKIIEDTLNDYKNSIKMVIVSGGGNDFAGLDDFDLILRDNCTGAQSIVDCFEAGQPGALFDTIENAYRNLILRVQRVIPAAFVVTHNYDYAVPTGSGLLGMGNWLKKPMDLAPALTMSSWRICFPTQATMLSQPILPKKPSHLCRRSLTRLSQ